MNCKRDCSQTHVPIQVFVNSPKLRKSSSDHTTFVWENGQIPGVLNFGLGTDIGGGGVLDFGLDGGVPPGPRDPNPCLEVKKVPMFRDFAQKMDPCLGIFWKFSGLALRAQKIFVILTKNGPMFRDLGVKNRTHV